MSLRAYTRANSRSPTMTDSEIAAAAPPLRTYTQSPDKMSSSQSPTQTPVSTLPNRTPARADKAGNITDTSSTKRRTRSSSRVLSETEKFIEKLPTYSKKVKETTREVLVRKGSDRKLNSKNNSLRKAKSLNRDVIAVANEDVHQCVDCEFVNDEEQEVARDIKQEILIDGYHHAENMGTTSPVSHKNAIKSQESTQIPPTSPSHSLPQALQQQVNMNSTETEKSVKKPDKLNAQEDFIFKAVVENRGSSLEIKQELLADGYLETENSNENQPSYPTRSARRKSRSVPSTPMQRNMESFHRKARSGNASPQLINTEITGNRICTRSMSSSNAIVIGNSPMKPIGTIYYSPENSGDDIQDFKFQQRGGRKKSVSVPATPHPRSPRFSSPSSVVTRSQLRSYECSMKDKIKTECKLDKVIFDSSRAQEGSCDSVARRARKKSRSAPSTPVIHTNGIKQDQDVAKSCNTNSSLDKRISRGMFRSRRDIEGSDKVAVNESQGSGDAPEMIRTISQGHPCSLQKKSKSNSVKSERKDKDCSLVMPSPCFSPERKKRRRQSQLLLLDAENLLHTFTSKQDAKEMVDYKSRSAPATPAPSTHRAVQNQSLTETKRQSKRIRRTSHR